MNKFIFLNLLILLISLSACKVDKGKIVVSLKNNLKTEKKVFSVSNVQLINHQFVFTGSNLDGVTTLKVVEGSNETTLSVDSKSTTQLIANSISNVSFAAGKVFDFVLSSASASTTFTVNFSLCDSTLNGKGFNCSVAAHDKDVLSYDANTNKWIPRAMNGLNYRGVFDASGGIDPNSGSFDVGDYYVINKAGTIGAISFAIGDWISYNGTSWDKIANSTVLTSVFGRTGAVVATKGDYDLNKLTDVDLTTTPPVNGNILKYNGVRWIPGANTVVETDPNVSAFAKSALPTCNAGEVLKGNGTSLSCVTTSTIPSGSAGGDLTGTYPNPTLAASGATAGTYKSVTIDAKGRVTAGTNPTTLAGYGITDSLVTGVTATAPVVATGTTAPVISMPAATTSVDGYLKATDWNVFNNKQAALSTGPTINGIIYPASGAATLQIPLAPVALTDAVNKQYVDMAVATGNGQWTTIIGDIYRATGKVGIGTNTPAAALDIASTQTASITSAGAKNIYTISNSASAAANTFTGTSNQVTTASSFPIGTLTGSSSTASYGGTSTVTNLNGSTSFATITKPTTSTTVVGANNTVSINPTSGTAAITSVYGSKSSVYTGFGGFGQTGTESIGSYAISDIVTGVVTNNYGVYGNSNNFGGTITNSYGGYFLSDTTSFDLTPSSYGVYGAVNNDFGSGVGITNAYGVYGQVKSTSGTITNGYGVYAEIVPTAPITNRYGVYIADVGAGANFYGLYSAGSTAKNTIAGSLGIGTSAPGSALDVKGTLRLSGATSGYVGFAPAAAAGTTTYTLPTTQGSSGQVLSTDGVATTPTLSWVTPLSSSSTLTGDVGGTIGSNSIGAGKIVNSQINAAAAIDYSKLNVPAAAIPLTALNATGTKDSTKYLKGDNTWSALATDIWATVLTGLTTGTSAIITAADSILVAFGKLQAQITTNTTSISGKADTTNLSQTISAATVTGLIAPIAGSDAANKTYVDGFAQWTKTGSDAYRTGKVGVGAAASPIEALDVTGNSRTSGQAYSSQYVLASGATVDFNNGNVQVLQSVGGAAITLNNMKDGGSYVLIITDTVARTYTFTNCTNSKFAPLNADTTASTTSIYNILKVTIAASTYCYISWSSGYQ